MNNQKITKILSVVVILIGTMVMVGWFLSIPILTSILPQWVTMKFSTALSFFLSGVILYFIGETQRGKVEWAQVALPIASLIILLLMATLLVSVLIGVRTGIEDLFVQEAEAAVKTTTPGRPSSGTMMGFILVAIAGVLTMFNLRNLRKYLVGIGSVVAIIGSVAIMGYIIDLPVLFYTISGVSTAMAFHTAILFVLLGVGSFLLGREK